MLTPYLVIGTYRLVESVTSKYGASEKNALSVRNRQITGKAYTREWLNSISFCRKRG